MRVEDGGQLGLDPAERRPDRLLPAQGAQSLQAGHRDGRDRDPGRGLALAPLADEPAAVEIKVWPSERIRAAAADAGIEPRTVAEEIHAPHAEADGHPGGPRRCLDATKAPHQEPVQGGVAVVIRGEPPDALDDPRPLREPLQVLPDAAERVHDVEVVDAEEVAPTGVEKHEVAQRERLERAAEPRAGAPRGAGDAVDLSEPPRIERDQAIALAEAAPTDHDRLRFPQPHSAILSAVSSATALRAPAPSVQSDSGAGLEGSRRGPRRFLAARGTQPGFERRLCRRNPGGRFGRGAKPPSESLRRSAGTRTRGGLSRPFSTPVGPRPRAAGRPSRRKRPPARAGPPSRSASASTRRA